MKKQTLCLVLGLSFLQFIYSQAKTMMPEQWAENPAIHPLPDQYARESAVIIAAIRRYEFIDNAKKEVEVTGADGKVASNGPVAR